MNENKTTEIINWLTQKTANKDVISPSVYIDVAMKLNLLIADEQAKLYELQQIVSQMKVVLMEAGNAISKAKIKVEATNDYKEYLTQKAKIEQIIEYIRIAKINAQISRDEMRGY